MNKQANEATYRRAFFSQSFAISPLEVRREVGLPFGIYRELYKTHYSLYSTVELWRFPDKSGFDRLDKIYSARFSTLTLKIFNVPCSRILS